jgi:hypothetical protein
MRGLPTALLDRLGQSPFDNGITRQLVVSQLRSLLLGDYPWDPPATSPRPRSDYRSYNGIHPGAEIAS